MDKVSICGLRFHAKHGCHPEERIIGSQYEVDIVLHVDIKDAAQSDHLTDAVDYVSVMEMADRVMSSPKNLIETVAHDICSEGLRVFSQVEHIAVTVKKLAPPVGFELMYVSVTASLDR